MFQYNIKIDLCEDYCKMIKRWMSQQCIESQNSGWDLCYDFFNLQKKLLEPLKRKVLFSKEFACPLELESSLNWLVSKFEAGQNVTPHLSKGAFTPSKFDELLYDWGIYHFHLGGKMDKKTGLIKRTGPILFAKVDCEKVYCINIYSHGKNAEPPWSKQSMLRILHNNWPETIQQYRLPGIVSICPDSARHSKDVEIAAMRKSHVFSLIEVADGIVYCPPGGGLMSSGHSVKIVCFCNRLWNYFKECEIYIKNNITSLVKRIEQETGKKLGYKLVLKLWNENGKFYVVDIISMVSLIKVDISM